MKEIHVEDLGLKGNSLVSYTYQTSFGIKIPKRKNLTPWWGRTYFYYDKTAGKLYAENLSWIGVALHKLFGYRSDLNRSRAWEFFKEKCQVKESPPAGKKFREIAFAKLREIGKKQDVRREFFKNFLHLNSEERIAYFSTKGLDPNSRDGEGVTVLYRAVERNDPALVCHLLKAGADPNISHESLSPDLQRPFEIAVYRGNIEMVRAFLEANVDVNAKGKDGRTPIFYACRAKVYGPGVRTHDFENAFMAMVFRSFKMEPKDFTAENAAREKNWHGVFNALLEKNLELNILDLSGRTPLSYAVESGDKDTVERLIEKGADVNLGKKNCSPLSYAVKGNSSELSTLLVEKGAQDI